MDPKYPESSNVVVPGMQIESWLVVAVPAMEQAFNDLVLNIVSNISNTIATPDLVIIDFICACILRG